MKVYLLIHTFAEYYEFDRVDSVYNTIEKALLIKADKEASNTDEDVAYRIDEKEVL